MVLVNRSTTMKRSYTQTLLFLASLTFVVSALQTSCTKGSDGSNDAVPECKPDILPDQYRTALLKDPHASAGEPGVVAVFKLVQNLQSYEHTACKTKTPVCGVSLVITNATDQTVSFDYTLNYSISTGNFWKYEGFARLNKGDTLNLGRINSNCSWISDGDVTVTTTNVSYK